MPLRKAAAAATILLGALFAGGAATANAAPVHTSAPAAGVTWHRLTMMNGWKSAGSIGTGFPSYAVKNGVVYLSGSVRQLSGNVVEFALLPKAARPAHLVVIPVYTNGDTNGWLEIYPTGNIYANSNPYTNAQDYTSLAGVSFPAARASAHKLSLRNGWTRSNQFWDTAPSYTISGGMVYLTGALRQSSGTGTVFGVLPKAARPAHVEYITVATSAMTTGSGTVPGILRITPNGTMQAYSAFAKTETWLGGVAFPVASATSHKLGLVNGWVSGQSRWRTGDPTWSVSGGVVHLTGSLIQHSAGAAKFATLPPGARPKHSLYIKVYTYGGSVGTLYIQPNGIIQAYSPTTADAQDYTSLAAISFPLGS